MKIRSAVKWSLLLLGFTAPASAVSQFVLIIWLTGPVTTDIGIGGKIAEVGPVLVVSYATKSSCTAILNRMVKTSGGKVRGRCDEWQ